MTSGTESDVHDRTIRNPLRGGKRSGFGPEETRTAIEGVSGFLTRLEQAVRSHVARRHWCTTHTSVCLRPRRAKTDHAIPAPILPVLESLLYGIVVPAGLKGEQYAAAILRSHSWRIDWILCRAVIVGPDLDPSLRCRVERDGRIICDETVENRLGDLTNPLSCYRGEVQYLSRGRGRLVSSRRSRAIGAAGQEKACQQQQRWSALRG